MQPRPSPQKRPAYLWVMAGLIWVAVVTALSIARFWPRHDDVAIKSAQSVLAMPTAARSAPTSTPETAPTDSTLLFALPIEDGNAHTTPGFAVADDGSFWIGNGQGRLEHYSPIGARLQVIEIPMNMQPIESFDVQGENIWLLDGYEGGFSSLHKLAQDGHVIVEYRLPETIKTPNGSWEPTFKGMTVVSTLRDGEVILGKIFESPYVRLIDAQGNFAPALLEGVPGPDGKLYRAEPDGPPIEGLHTGHVTIDGRVQVTVTMSGALYELNLLRVDPDGSFYVSAMDVTESAPGAPVDAEEYILHYSAGGELLAHSRVPPSQRLASDRKGTFFYATPQLSSTGVFDRLEVYRVNSFATSQPLPVLPTRTPTAILPTNTPAPPTPTYTPSATPIADLATLARKSEGVARVRLEPIQAAMGTMYSNATVIEWLKRPADLALDNFSFAQPYGPNGEIPIARPFREGRTFEYILFLTLQDTSYSMGDTGQFVLVDDISGPFSIIGGKIDYAGMPKYAGWTVEQFEAAVRSLVPTPVPMDEAAKVLTSLGSRSTVVEIEIVRSPEFNPVQLPNGYSLHTVHILNWLKPSPQAGMTFAATYIGLALKADMSKHLLSGSGHYILFLGTSESLTVCEMSELSGYSEISEQSASSGIFEITPQGRIGYAGIEGYAGRTLDALKKDIARFILVQEEAPNSGGLDLKSLSGMSEVVAEVDLAPDGKGTETQTPGNSDVQQEKVVVKTAKVLKWLKKPDGLNTATLRVMFDPNDLCRLQLPSDYQVVFLFQKEKYPEDSPLYGTYMLAASTTFGFWGIRSGIIQYTGLGEYWMMPIEKLEDDLAKQSP